MRPPSFMLFWAASVPKEVFPRSCRPVRVWPIRFGLTRFSHHKRVFFRLRSAGSACFHRVHRDHYMLLLLLHALNTCIRCSGLVHRIGGEYSGLVHSKPLNPRRSVENSWSGSSGLGGVPRGSDLVSLPRAVTVSERSTGAAGTGRMTRRVESQGRLPASRSRGRATRS